MTFDSQTTLIKKSLPEIMKTEHFAVHFALRNPPVGKGWAAHGVRDRAIILTYLHSLESLYATMRSDPWNRNPPAVDSDGKTHVYVFGDNPLTTFDKQSLIPEIFLPSRSREPTTQGELHRAAAEAVHEGTHLFNYEKRPFYDPNADSWIWFDEGMAVLMETLVAAGNPDYCRFLVDWIDSPETPLDDEESKYQSGMFMRFLGKRLGLDFVNKVWTESNIDESPIEALSRLMTAGEVFLSANPEVNDIFGSGYCIAPYFIWDHESASLAPDILVRFGERAISEAMVLGPGESGNMNGSVDHLACRYYRLYVKSGVVSLKIELTPDDVFGPSPLKAEIASVTPERTRSAAIPLAPNGKVTTVGNKILSVSLNSLNPETIDHFVLIVSNCGTKSSEKHFHNHDDHKSYVINVVAS